MTEFGGFVDENVPQQPAPAPPALLLICDDMSVTGIALGNGTQGVLLTLRNRIGQANFGMDETQARALLETLQQTLGGLVTAREMPNGSHP